LHLLAQATGLGGLEIPSSKFQIPGTNFEDTSTGSGLWSFELGTWNFRPCPAGLNSAPKL